MNNKESLNTEPFELVEVEISSILKEEEDSFSPPKFGLKSFFYRDVGERISDTDAAIEFYENLEYDEFLLRDSILFWENGAAEKFYFLMENLRDCVSKSIDIIALMSMELDYVNQLLKTGCNNTLFKIRNSHADKIPLVYLNLLYGKNIDIFFHDELDAFRRNVRIELNEFLDAFFCRWEEVKKQMSIQKVDAYEDEDEDEDEDEYEDEYKYDIENEFFNAEWHAALTIQIMVWYKEILVKSIADGELKFEFSLDWPEPTPHPEKIPQIEARSVVQLKRQNDGYVAMKASYDQFKNIKQRIPSWGELMLFMFENPPTGFVITGKKKDAKTVEYLDIEGVEKLIDRDAFSKRFRRYFPKGY